MCRDLSQAARGDAAGLPGTATGAPHASKRVTKVNTNVTNQDGNTRRAAVNAGSADQSALRTDRRSAERVAAQRCLRVVVAEARRLSRQLRSPGQLPRTEVTKWSKIDTLWKGVSVDTLLATIETEAGYLTAWSDGGYTTSLPLEDVTDGKAWIAYEYDGSRLTPSTAAGPPPRAALVLLEKREMGYAA